MLKTHNGFKLRVMQVAHRLYLPASNDVNGQTVPGAIIPDRHDGVAMLKELLEYLSGPDDSKDVNEHLLYLQTMRANPLSLNATEEQYAQRCKKATEKHNLYLPTGKQMVGRELSKFFIEQMPTVMTQRGQLLY